MAFFKFRKSSDEASAAPTQPESLEVMRRRAKHRLLGAALLVIVGVAGFPLLFDRQPRPIAVDIPIEVPDRAKVKPLPIPEPTITPAPAVLAVSAAPAASAVASATGAASAASKPTLPVTAVESVAPIKAPEKVAEKQSTKPPSAPAKIDDAARAQALLDGQEPSPKADAASGRFVVQVGAFTDAARVRDVRQKVEQLGLKTYTQVVDTKEGRRIRVRVGPYATRLEADKVAEKIKALKLHASTLSL